jgi:hypothetical protein
MKARPRHSTAGQNVDVHVVDGLPSVLAGIDHQAKPLCSATLAAQPRRHRHQAGRERRVGPSQIDDRRVMRDREYERVERRLRIEVLNGDHVVVARNDVGGHLPGGNSAENAVVH